MDRDKFISAVNADEKPMDRGHYKDVIRQSRSISSRDRDLIWCISEMAELQQALSKELLGKGDIVNILEEVADVLICIGYIQEIIGLPDDAIVAAMNVKIKEIEKNEKTGRSK